MSDNNSEERSRLESPEDNWYGINRRTVLKSAAVGAGIAGMSGLATAGGHGGPCFKDFGCDEGTYVKFEFVAETDDEGNVTCGFEEETDTGLITITDWETKEGEKCEPVSVEWESDGYVVNNVLAFGGEDCDTDGFDLDGERGSYSSQLENDGGNTAAISNLQFCVVPNIFGETVSVGYEDLPLEVGNDYDYNDWLVDINTTATGSPIESLEFEFVPQARGAAADHQFRVDFPDIFCDASWTLTYDDFDGAGSEPADVTGDFSTTAGRDIEIFNRTSDVLPTGSNTNAGNWGSGCVQPDYTATLTITFDSPCEIDTSAFALTDSPHGQELPFKPYILVYNDNKGQDGAAIMPGDVRMLTVPQDWTWPQERVPIWDVYGTESTGTVTQDPGTGQPVFENQWYTDTAESSLLSTCDPSTGTTS